MLQATEAAQVLDRVSTMPWNISDICEIIIGLLALLLGYPWSLRTDHGMLSYSAKSETVSTAVKVFCVACVVIHNLWIWLTCGDQMPDCVSLQACSTWLHRINSGRGSTSLSWYRRIWNVCALICLEPDYIMRPRRKVKVVYSPSYIENKAWHLEWILM
jgi:hypothetical protein